MATAAAAGAVAAAAVRLKCDACGAQLIFIREDGDAKRIAATVKDQQKSHRKKCLGKFVEQPGPIVRLGQAPLDGGALPAEAAAALADAQAPAETSDGEGAPAPVSVRAKSKKASE